MRLVFAISAAAVALALAFACGARAATSPPSPPPYVPPPYVAPTEDPNVVQYGDASIHFVAPPGWKRHDLPGADDGSMTIVFAEPVKIDPTEIAITIVPFEGGLSRFEIDHEQSIRQAGGYVASHTLERLPNGMPAYFVRSTAGDGTSATQSFDWLAIDGKRSITATVSSRRDVVDEATARRELSTLTVVVYPS